MEGTLSARYSLRHLLKEGENGFQLTTSIWYGGAIAVLYPSVLDSLKAIFGCNLLITMPSPHVARIHPVKMFSPPELKRALDEYRRMPIGKELFSPYVYRYDSPQMGMRIIL